MRQPDPCEQSDLPTNIIDISEALEMRGRQRLCLHESLLVVAAERRVECKKCGAEVTAWDALLTIAESGSRYHKRIRALYEQRQQLLNWRPHLVAVRALERIWRGRKMLPCCPHCGRGVKAEALANGRQTSLQLEEARQRRET